MITANTTFILFFELPTIKAEAKLLGFQCKFILWTPFPLNFDLAKHIAYHVNVTTSLLHVNCYGHSMKGSNMKAETVFFRFISESTFIKAYKKLIKTSATLGLRNTGVGERNPLINGVPIITTEPINSLLTSSFFVLLIGEKRKIN